MDELRGIAVLLVIVWHSVAIPAAAGLEMHPTVRWVNDSISPYRIPMWLFLSGLLLDQSLGKGLVRYYEGKARHVLWPYLVWSVILIFTWHWDGPHWTNKLFWMGATYLWFLVVIGACYTIGPITRVVHPVFLVVAMVLLSPIPDTSIYGNILWYGAFFFAGNAASRYLTKWLAAPPWLAAVFGVVALVWAVFSASTYGYAPRENLGFLLLSLTGIVTLIWVASRAPRVRWLEWVGQRSIVFYVGHFPVMATVYYVIEGRLPAAVTYPLLLASGIGACILLTRLRRTVLFQGPPLLPRRRPSTTRA